jgi:hypothetical protein
MPPFNKSKISLKLNTTSFTLFRGHALGKACFHNIKGKETFNISYNDLNSTDHNIGLTESFSLSIELCDVHGNLYFVIYFDFSLPSLTMFGSKLSVTKLWIRWAYYIASGRHGYQEFDSQLMVSVNRAWERERPKERQKTGKNTRRVSTWA